MRKLKIVLILGMLLSCSASLFASNGRVMLHLTTNFGTKEVVETVVERRQKGSPYWVRCVKIPAFIPYITVGNLIDGEEYEFRVFLASLAGLGDPSDPTELIKIEPQWEQQLEVECRAPSWWRPNYVMTGPAENSFTNELGFEQEPRIPFRW